METNNIKNTEAKKVSLGFAALYPYEEQSIPTPDETQVRGKDFITWGLDNQYGEFLDDLNKNSATLHSIITSCIDYISGNDVLFNGVSEYMVNRKEETISDVLDKLSYDYITYGTAYIQVVRNKVGQVAEIYYVDAKNMRSNEDNTVFYYSEDWGKSYGRVNYITYPKFNPLHTSIPNSIVQIKTPQSRGVYGVPVYVGAITSCVIEQKINEWHLGLISNGMFPSAIINMNNGKPSDEDKAEIEAAITDKFSGSGNAGRVLISFNDSEKNKCTIEKLSDDNSDTKFIELQKRAQRQILYSFRASGLLFGILDDTQVGFSTEEFNDAFRLFNRTFINPIQKLFQKTFKKIYGSDVLSIQPFTME